MSLTMFAILSLLLIPFDLLVHIILLIAGHLTLGLLFLDPLGLSSPPCMLDLPAVITEPAAIGLAHAMLLEHDLHIALRVQLQAVLLANLSANVLIVVRRVV